MIKKLKLGFLFYRSLFLLSFVTSLVAGYFCFQHGMVVFLPVFIFKIIIASIGFILINNYKSKEYFYYFNLGIRKIQLWIMVFCWDFLLFFGVVYLAFLFYVSPIRN